jgi:hypothetical protein
LDHALEEALAIGHWRQLAAHGGWRALDSARYGALLYHGTVAAEKAAEEAAGLLLLLLLLLLRLLLLLLLLPRKLARAPLAPSARAEELGSQEALEAAREH